MAPRGMLEIFIFGGSGLKNTDKPGNIYCIASYKDEENRTNPVECDGSDPEWNEKFQFTIADDDIDDLKIQVIDEDEDGNDDDPGYCSISIEGLLETGYKSDIAATDYDVFRGDEAYGNINVSMAFFPEENNDDEEQEEEEEQEDE
ncbi:elicitor-responsive protein 3-like [Rosa sericea]